MTVHLNPLSWFRKPEPPDFGPPAMTTSADTANLQFQNAVAKVYVPTPPPPHPCESRGHDYAPLNKSAREILLACVRCADVQRIPVRLAPPAPQPRWRPADLA